MKTQHKKKQLNSRDESIRRAISCAQAFSTATNLGCMVTDLAGEVVYREGSCCESCPLCSLLGLPKNSCSNSQYFGMSEAERFGGKYIYYCTLGLTCFVSPIMGKEGSEAKVTVGPLLMVDADDFVSCDIEDRYDPDEETMQKIWEVVKHLPKVQPRRVTELSTLLFMAAGFMNNMEETYSMMEKQNADVIQGKINSYILQLKKLDEKQTRYPLEKEAELLRRVRARELEEAHEMLSELAGSLFFTSGGAVPAILCRVREVTALLSRAAIDAGAEAEKVLECAAKQQEKLDSLHTPDAIINAFVRNAQEMMRYAMESDNLSSAIRTATQMIRNHAADKITLQDAARTAGLSESYFSRLFRKETGMNFIQYLNVQRVENAKPLLRYSDDKLAEIAQAVGFEDHSYFTRVFKEVTGMLPSEYRDYRNRAKISKQ